MHARWRRRVATDQLTLRIHFRVVFVTVVHLVVLLCAAIHAKFGEATRFRSCSANGMDANAVIDFLDARGKFTGTPEAFSFDTTRRCSH